MKPYPYMKTQYKVLFRVVDVTLSLSISSCLAWGFHPTLVRSRFSCFLLYFVSPSFFLVLFTLKLLQCPQLLHLHFPLMLLLMIFLLHFKFDSRECITWHINTSVVVLQLVWINMVNIIFSYLLSVRCYLISFFQCLIYFS